MLVDPVTPDVGTLIERPKGFVVSPGADDIDHGSDSPYNPAKPSLIGASFRGGNTVASFFGSERNEAYDYPEPDFKPWDSIKGTKYERYWADFADVRNTRAADARKREIDREEEDRKVRDAAPWYLSLPLNMLAGTLDLPTLLPGGAFVRGVRGGFSVGRSALNVSAAAGASSLVQELALHGTQVTRTFGESAENVGASIVLGGMFGGGIAKLLSNREYNQAIRALNTNLGGQGGRIYDDVFDNLKATGRFTDEQAELGAAIIANRYVTRAKRLGLEDPYEYFLSDVGLQVRAGEVPAAPVALEPTGARIFEQPMWPSYHGTAAEENFNVLNWDMSKGVGIEKGVAFFSPEPGLAESFSGMSRERSARTMAAMSAYGKFTADLRKKYGYRWEGKETADERAELSRLYNTMQEAAVVPPGAAGERIVPVKIDPGKTETFDASKLFGESEEFHKAFREVYTKKKHGAVAEGVSEAELPAYFERRLEELRGQYNYHEKQRAEILASDNHDIGPWEATTDLIAPIIKMAKDRGLDTARITGLAEGGEQILVFNNKNIRPMYEQGGIPSEVAQPPGEPGRPAAARTFEQEAVGAPAAAGEPAPGREPGRPGAGAPGLEEAQRTAAAASGGHVPLQGLPRKPIAVGEEYFVPGPVAVVHGAAETYMRQAGLPYRPIRTYRPVDEARATRIADAYTAMVHDPTNPQVATSYDAMINETIAQFRALEKSGIKFEFIKDGQADPYALSPRLAQKDLIENKHLWVFPTSQGFGAGTEASAAAMRNNPLLRMTDIVIDGKQLQANDVFRIVHDVYGHVKDGVGFRAAGEENAWRSHSTMYSDLARPAMTSETRGQNSWVNYGPHGEANRTASAADTVYADQKIGLLPDWVFEEGRADVLPAGMQTVDFPGFGTATETIHGVEPSLRVAVPPEAIALPEDKLILAGTNIGNAARQIAAIDDILTKFPNATSSSLEWSKMMAYALKSHDIPVPPYAFIRDMKNNAAGAIDRLSRLSPGQLADADHGFEGAREAFYKYTTGQMAQVNTGRVFLWSFLSRGVSPYTQESLFIDAFEGASHWINKAFDGKFTEADFEAYTRWAASVAPKGTGLPGAGSLHNLNAFGRLFLHRMGATPEGGGDSLLVQLHKKMSDANETGPAIRRWFIENTEGVGIDNKVLSFSLLVTGRPDVMVLDRVQVNGMWNDGKFGRRNLYQVRKDQTGKEIPASTLAELTFGARGLLVYEAIERELNKQISGIYTALGRPEDASIGRYHWETWVSSSQQEASHGTLRAALADEAEARKIISQVRATEGEYGAYQYGTEYGRDASGPYFVYHAPDGTTHEFSVGAFRDFLDTIQNPRNGVVPREFKVTEDVGNVPWYERPEVNKARLSELAAQYADRGPGAEAAGFGEGARARPELPGEVPLADRQRTADTGEVSGGVSGDRAAGRRLSAETEAFVDVTPRTLYQEARGQIEISPGKTIVTLFRDADASTFMHEMGHKWLDELVQDAAHPKATQAIKDDLATTLKWLGVERAEDIGRAQHEKWAQGFEQYLASGKAPSSALERAFEAFKVWMKAIYNSMAQLGAPISDDVRGVMDRLIATDQEILATAGRLSPTGRPTPAGAAAVLPEPVDWNTIAGRGARAVAAATAQLNPLLRSMHSPSATYRQIAGHMMENPLYLKKNLQFIASNPAAETLMKEWNGGLVKAIETTNDAFVDYRKAGGTLGRDKFNEEVGMAMRNDDKHADPHIAKAAQEWRKEVFDPLKEAAIKAGLLPEDVEVTTAASYLSRMWNRTKLIAKPDRFKQIVTDFYSGVLANEYENSRKALVSRLAKWDQEITDLKLDPEKRLVALDEIESKLTELDTKAGGLVDQAAKLSDLQAEVKAARAAGNEAQVTAKQADIAAAKEAGGDALKAYMDERAGLRSRRKAVDLGYAGLSERAQGLFETLADIEEESQRRLGRLIERGQKFERDVSKLDPEKLAARLNDMRSRFAELLAVEERTTDRLAKQKERIEADLKKAQQAQKEGLQPVAPHFAHVRLQERIDAAIEAQVERTKKLNSLSDRIAAAEGFDQAAAVDALKDVNARMIAIVSNSTLAKGERAARLKERLANFDPKRVDDRIEAIEKMKAEHEARFYADWEVKKLGEGVSHLEATRPNFNEMAKEIADHIHDTLTGKTDTGNTRPEFITVKARGPLKERTFNIPDDMVKEFLEHDVELIGRRYTRTMGADIELANMDARLGGEGSPDLASQIGRIKKDYDALRAGVTDEKILVALDKRERSDIGDLEAVRDLLRGTGTFYSRAVEGNYNRMVNAFNHMNYMRLMGEVVLASLTDAIRPGMVHGLMPFLGHIGQLMTNMSGVKMSVAEGKLAGNVSERATGHRLATITEIMDPYSPRSPVEALLRNGAEYASKFNGIRLWTDWMKSIAVVLTQDRILKNVLNFANIKDKEKSYLAFLGIDQSWAERIAKQFEAHGDTNGGVHIANTEKWREGPNADPEAIRRFRAALNKDADSIIVQKGVGDTPLFANTPTGRALLQFKSFALASHQRVLLRGLQEDQTRFIGSIIAMTTMGMFMTYMKALSGNRTDKLQDWQLNPGHYVAEGLDRSGVLAVPMEVANAMEKLVHFNPIKTPLKLGDQGSNISQKNQNRNEVGAALGPTLGYLEDIRTTLGMGKTWFDGEEIKKSQMNAAERILPYHTFIGIRQAAKYLVNPPQ